MKRKDILLTLFLILLAGLAYLYTLIIGNAKGSRVVVNVEGQEYGTFPLNENKEIDVKIKDGYNIIIIRDGKVSIKDADCPDKYCVNQGKINKSGESIICLPHKMSVSISASDEGSGTDAVAR